MNLNAAQDWDKDLSPYMICRIVAPLRGNHARSVSGVPSIGGAGAWLLAVFLFDPGESFFEFREDGIRGDAVILQHEAGVGVVEAV